MTDQKLLLSEDEFCELIGIAKITARRLRQKNQLPHTRIGKKVLFTQNDVQDFLKQHAVRQ